MEVVKCLRPVLGRQRSRKVEIETDGQGLEVAIVHVGGNLFVRETYNPQVKHGIVFRDVSPLEKLCRVG